MKAIIIGAASGIGRELTFHLSSKGYLLGLGDIDLEKLEQLTLLLKTDCIIHKIDVSNTSKARMLVSQMIDQLNGIDLFIYTAGIKDKSQIWENEYHLYNVNAIGFASLTSLVFDYYKNNSIRGRIAGLTSVLAVRGLKQACSYCASKAFMHTYMQGLRHRASAEHLGIIITEIRPGFVTTPMIEGQEGLFWTISPKEAAKEIMHGIDKKAKMVYIKSRWILIACILKWVPDYILHAKAFQPKNY